MILISLCLLFLSNQLVACSTCPGDKASNYSLWMAESIISRHQGIITNASDSSQPLQAGITQKAFRRLLNQYPHHESTANISAYIVESVDSVIGTLGNATHDTALPLDRLSNGNNLIKEYQETHNASYRDTFEALRTSIDLQRRNEAGGLFYFTYPYWSYLDGMFSFAPFYTLYTKLYGNGEANTTALSDVKLQFDLLWQHCWNNATGLLVHGYDYSKTAVWADPITGASPHVWGRALGWYMMALVDTLEIMPVSGLKSKLATLAVNIVKAADPETGVWWQVLDQPGREGNYLESSGSSMFVYALLKGARLGYIPSYDKVAARAYEYIVDNFVVNNHNGTLGWNRTVAVCSLNSNATYEYYVGQPILYNSILGEGAFVLASLEYELNSKA